MRQLWKSLARTYDALVVPSFGAPGFNARQRTWDSPPAPDDLRGTHVAVSGANSGIGFATAKMLATRGATVHMLCRHRGRGHNARQTLAESTGNEDLTLHIVDVADVDSVTSFCDEFLATGTPLHSLVHNAGALLDERTETAQRLETTFACHVLGPFLATRRLIPLLSEHASDSRRARVVWVSSGGMYTQHLDLDRLETGGDPYDGVAAYAQCKRAQVILAQEFARRFAGEPVAFSAMHPGWVQTSGVEKSLPRFARVTAPLLRTPEQGADTVVWLAASPQSNDASGEFYLDRESRRKHLPFGSTEASREELEQLWSRLLDLEKSLA